VFYERSQEQAELCIMIIQCKQIYFKFTPTIMVSNTENVST